MPRGRRIWTAEEDARLRTAVRKGKQWVWLLSLVPGRIPVSSIAAPHNNNDNDPSLASDESRPLLWREIAKSVPGRNNKDCRRRWCNSLNSLTKGPWSESEDERLWNAVRKHGSKWSQVAQVVGTRNSDQCSSHWSQTLNPEINYGDWTPDEVLHRAVDPGR
jgi:hypothetical protein